MALLWGKCRFWLSRYKDSDRHFWTILVDWMDRQIAIGRLHDFIGLSSLRTVALWKVDLER